MLSERNIDDCLFVLIKIYNAGHEAAQLKTHTDQHGIIDCVGDIQNKKYNFQWQFQGNICFFFSRSAKGENKFEITHFSKYNSNKGKAETC